MKNFNLYSLGRKTDLIFANFSGRVIEKENYFIIQTPSNPSYHWGNFLIFKEAPKQGDLAKWKGIFDQEFPYYEEPHHYTFTWDQESPVKGEIDEFLVQDFEFDTGVVLTTNTLRPPKHINQDIEFRVIETDNEWKECVELQCKCADPKFLNNYYRSFKESQFQAYRELSNAGKGHWFGAFLNEELVGDLGIYFEGQIARYQSVGTHPDYRRKGICGTLVYQAGEYMLKQYPIETFVMEADPDYHAARIYESVGFEGSEINYSLSWWKR